MFAAHNPNKSLDEFKLEIRIRISKLKFYLKYNQIPTNHFNMAPLLLAGFLVSIKLRPNGFLTI